MYLFLTMSALYIPCHAYVAAALKPADKSSFNKQLVLYCASAICKPTNNEGPINTWDVSAISDINKCSNSLLIAIWNV